MTHNKILEMLKDPESDDKEINARFGACINNIPWTRIGKEFDKAPWINDYFYHDKLKSGTDPDKCDPFNIPYLTCLTSIKAVQDEHLEGYLFHMEEHCELETLHKSCVGFEARLIHFIIHPDKYFRSPILPIEERARMHAVVQALSYKRRMKNV